MTSHDVVARIRRFTGIRRVGHAGTLDPFATGVVVVAVGRATRVLQYVQDTDKLYLAHVVLGAETDTGDVEGTVVARTEPGAWPDQSGIEDALTGFVGEIEQVPPVYSAIKVGGQPLHRQVRAGKNVTAPSRTVHVHSIDIVEYDPPDLLISVHCGKGTYVRSLARDIGEVLDTRGYCHGLRRIASGPFGVSQAWSLDDLRDIDTIDHWRDIALHPDFALSGIPALILSGNQERAWYHGQSFVAVHSTDDVAIGGGIVRIYGPSGDFAGVGQIDADGTVRPTFVFNVVDEGEGL